MGLLPASFHGLVLVRTTLGNRADAESLARRLVESRLAGCAHVAEIGSVYRWEGAVRQETEFLVEARTTSGGRAALARAMEQGHPYDTPLVESIAVAQVPAKYAAWLRGEVR